MYVQLIPRHSSPAASSKFKYLFHLELLHKMVYNVIRRVFTCALISGLQAVEALEDVSTRIRILIKAIIKNDCKSPQGLRG